MTKYKDGKLVEKGDVFCLLDGTPNCKYVPYLLEYPCRDALTAEIMWVVSYCTDKGDRLPEKPVLVSDRMLTEQGVLYLRDGVQYLQSVYYEVFTLPCGDCRIKKGDSKRGIATFVGNGDGEGRTCIGYAEERGGQPRFITPISSEGVLRPFALYVKAKKGND